jgi:RNA polymerase subunit RPABC4/transcription elongation factor Spt4
MFRKGLGIHTKELGWQDNVRKMLLGHSDITTTIKAYSDYNINDIVREFNQKGSQVPQNQQQYFQSQFPNNQFVNNNVNQPVQNGEFCPFCKRAVKQEMILCPWCGKEIKRICNTCKRYINASWKICPYCGTDVHKKRKYDYTL